MHKAELNRLLDRESPAESRFDEFCRLLDATLHHESTVRLRALKAAYQRFDPDAEPCRDWPSDGASRETQADALFEQFAELLRLCNYRRLPHEEIEQALEAASDWGVNLRLDFSMFRRLDVYVNHETVDQYTRCKLRNLYRKQQVDVPVFGRLAVIFELHGGVETTRRQVEPEHVYLKLFKNIPKQDVDMLLPGARVRMTLLDQGKIILPTVTGIGMTAIKLFKGAALAAAFAGFYGLLGFLVLVGGTVGYGVKSFFGYQRTKEKYHLHLTRNLYYQNLANGRSVLFHLLDEAQEQEYQEASLAYYILWRAPGSLSAAQIDQQAEAFLREQAGCQIDFDIADALAKLERLELATSAGDQWQSVSLVEAIARLDRSWDNLFLGGAEQPSAAPDMIRDSV
jgi:hypothetical protein